MARPDSTYRRVKDEAACATNELCMRSYRDHSNIHVASAALAELLAAASTKLLGCVDKLHWKVAPAPLANSDPNLADHCGWTAALR